MRAEVRAFVVEQLADMNYDVEGLDDDTTLGPAGVDLESLALADLSVRVEDRYGVTFADDESEQLALMTVGEFTTMVANRVTQAAAATGTAATGTAATSDKA
ncbi:acyl carrier protein [Micromonospora taraxaci]|uniref:acyl carrier protein n=1 Tax=Micromonospora taraxaci TaxID=1316803 RepID=UPI0033F68B20